MTTRPIFVVTAPKSPGDLAGFPGEAEAEAWLAGPEGQRWPGARIEERTENVHDEPAPKADTKGGAR